MRPNVPDAACSSPGTIDDWDGANPLGAWVRWIKSEYAARGTLAFREAILAERSNAIRS